MIAVIPCAGRGTRMGRLTRVVPKEVLPFGSRVIIDFIFDELKTASIRDVLIIIHPQKEVIRNYVESTYSDFSFEFVYQSQPRGLAHAYSLIADIIDGDFITIFPDHIVYGNVIGKMLDLYQTYKSEGKYPFVLKSYVSVPRDEAVFSTGKRSKQPDTNRNTGRAIYPRVIFDYIPVTFPKGKELSEIAIEQNFSKYYKIYSHHLDAIVWDIGTLDGYLFYLKKYLAQS